MKFQTPIAQLSPSERNRKITELLVKAILLSGARRAVSSAERDDPFPESTAVSDPASDDERIIRYLEVVRRASPGVIREALGLPKTSVYRCFLRLAAEGRIATTGRSRSLSYSLVEREPPRDKIVLN